MKVDRADLVLLFRFLVIGAFLAFAFVCLGLGIGLAIRVMRLVGGF